MNIVIGIGGGSGTGNTTMAKAIAGELHPIDVAIVQQESYYEDRSYLSEEKRESINYDHPSAFDTELLI